MESPISKSIVTLQKQLGEHVDNMTALLLKAEAEDRDLNDEEKTLHAGAEKSIADLQVRLDRLEAQEKLAALRAKPVNTGVIPAAEKITVKSNEPKGVAIARAAIALFQAGGNAYVAAQIAEKSYKDNPEVGLIIKSAVAVPTTTASTHDDLLRPKYAEFMDLLRPQLVLGALDLPRASFDSSREFKIPKRVGKVSGGYVAEGAAIPVAAGSFDTLTLTPFKMGVITPVTKELLRKATPAAEMIIRDDMIESTAEAIDLQFLSGTYSAGVKPAGLIAIADTNTDASAGYTAAKIRQDIYTAKASFINANALKRGVWVMHPLQVEFLRTVEDDNGNLVFAEDVAAGTLAGLPIVTSTQQAVDKFLLVDVAQLIFVDDAALALEMSTEASLQVVDNPATPVPDTSANVVSLFQNDLVAFKLTLGHTWAARRTPAVHVTTAVDFDFSH